MPNVARPFWSLVKKGGEEECWLFTGHIKRDGYGEYCHVRAHRYAYELLVGVLSNDMILHHVCRNKTCVNPKHLQVLSAREHFWMSPGGACGKNARKTHCENGHELFGDNLYIDSNGGRACVTCRKEAAKRFNEKQN